jgi:hypothetical protein
MRYIYIDEAGTSANEPISVVVGIIVDADTQWKAAEARINDIRKTVPAQFQDNFIFHATEIWNSKKYRPLWSMDDRLALLYKMMALPRSMGIPISIGIVRRNAPKISPNIISEAQFQHVMAFHGCIGRSDKYIREHGHTHEVATVVAEDVPELKKFLRMALTMLRTNPIVLSPEFIAPTQAERKSGTIFQETEQSSSRIVDTIHFVEKRDGPLLQIANACAFGFRRYFSEQSFGEEFVRSMIGTDLVREDWAGPCSFSTFSSTL